MSGLAFDAMRTTPPPPPYCDAIGINPLDYISVRSRDGQVFVVHRACLCTSPLIRRAFARRKSVHLDNVVISFDNQWQDESYCSHNTNKNNEIDYGMGNDARQDSSPCYLAEHSTNEREMHVRSAKTPSRIADSISSGESLNKTAPPQSSNTPASDQLISAGNNSETLQEEQQQQQNHNTQSSISRNSVNDNTSRVNVLSANSNTRFSVGWETTAPSSVSGMESSTLRGSISKVAADSFIDATMHTYEHHNIPVTLTDTPLHDRTVQIYFPVTSGATLETVISYMHYKLRYDGHPELERPELEIPIASAIEIMKLAHTLECEQGCK